MSSRIPVAAMTRRRDNVDGMADFEQLAPLGRHFSYNNASFCVAGRIIEVLTGATYEEALRELIFEPLGMERSFLIPDQVMLHRFAVGHQAAEDGHRVLSPWAIPRGDEWRWRDLLRHS